MALLRATELRAFERGKQSQPPVTSVAAARLSEAEEQLAGLFRLFARHFMSTRSHSTFAVSSFVVFALAGCVVQPTDPVAPETFALRATVTPDNKCTVEALGRTYTSIGQVRGAVLPTFSGSLENDGYHAIGCWVANADGTDGELVVTFSGNSFQQPFPTGTFEPLFEPPFGSTEKLVSVSFRASFFPNQKLRTNNGAGGTVVVESAPSGARTIRVDVMAIKYQT